MDSILIKLLITMTSLVVITIVLSIMQQLAVEKMKAASATTINLLVLPGDGSGSCATNKVTQDAIASLETIIRSNIAGLVLVTECGGGLWYPVASLDMTDPQQ